MAKAKQKKPKDKAAALLEKIDPALLRQQRLGLLMFLSRYRSHKWNDEIIQTHYNSMEGIQSLLDSIADYLADELGKAECLLEDDFEFEQADTAD